MKPNQQREEKIKIRRPGSEGIICFVLLSLRSRISSDSTQKQFLLCDELRRTEKKKQKEEKEKSIYLLLKKNKEKVAPQSFSSIYRQRKIY
jgi:hypothetical protein